MERHCRECDDGGDPFLRLGIERAANGDDGIVLRATTIVHGLAGGREDETGRPVERVTCVEQDDVRIVLDLDHPGSECIVRGDCDNSNIELLALTNESSGGIDVNLGFSGGVRALSRKCESNPN